LIGTYLVLFIICMAGAFLSAFLPFPLPASVCAMLLMFLVLSVRAVRPEPMQKVAAFLLGNMALFFVPPGVGIIAHVEKLRGSALVLFFICVAATLITFAATALTVHVVKRVQAALTQKGEA
jgi:Putative effector of murein hydrolase LrgA